MRRDELIAIHDCPVHTARIRALVHALVQHLPRGDELPLAYLHVAGAQATLVVKAHHVDQTILARAIEAAGGTGLEGLWLHLHPAAGRKLFARSGWQHLWGAPQSRDPHGLLHGPAAFMQAFPRLHRESLLAAREYLAPGARHCRARPVLRARQHAARVDPRRKSVAGRRTVRRGGEVRGAECARCDGAARHVRAAVAADPRLVERASARRTSRTSIRRGRDSRAR